MFKTYVAKAISLANSEDSERCGKTITDPHDLLQLARKELQQIVTIIQDGSLITEIVSASTQGNRAFLYALKEIAQNTFYFFL